MFKEAIDEKEYQEFANSYKSATSPPSFFKDWVEPAGKGKVKLTNKAAESLQRTYDLFTGGEPIDTYSQGVVDSAIWQMENALGKAIEGTELKSDDFKITVKVGDQSTKVSVNHKPTGIDTDFDGGYYHTTEYIVDGFDSWDWLAALADEESPWYSETFFHYYVETQCMQAAQELLDLNNQGDLDEQVKEYVKEIAEEKSI